MKEQVKLRKADIRKELIENGGGDIQRSDVFSRLVLANESETEKLPLDEQELVCNYSLPVDSSLIAALSQDWKYFCLIICWPR